MAVELNRPVDVIPICPYTRRVSGHRPTNLRNQRETVVLLAGISENPDACVVMAGMSEAKPETVVLLAGMSETTEACVWMAGISEAKPETVVLLAGMETRSVSSAVGPTSRRYPAGGRASYPPTPCPDTG